MHLHTTDDGTTVDLEHVLAVGAVTENYKYVEPYMYTVTLAFNNSVIIGYDDKASAKRCREKFITAWTAFKGAQRA